MRRGSKRHMKAGHGLLKGHHVMGGRRKGRRK